MPTSLLQLPRELRDQIYEYVLISPTHVIEPILLSHPNVKPSRRHYPSSKITPQFRLQCRPAQSLLLLYRQSRGLPEPGQSAECISLSLVRTCRQIHFETLDLFWKNHTFYFHDDIVKNLKAMRQIPSRLISSITLNLSGPANFSTLPKAMKALASRARHGCLRHLSVEIDSSACVMLSTWRDSANTDQQLAYDVLLEHLRSASGGFKNLKVRRMDLWPTEAQILWRDRRDRGNFGLVRDLGLAWSGKLFWKGVLVWEDDGWREEGLAEPVINSDRIGLK